MLAGSVLIGWVLLERAGNQAVPVGALPGAPKVIGWLLFHDFLLPFEVTSILVLIAIMGAVVLASPPGQKHGKKEG
jgi:NADH:ubiquinone oxidoreductase subunit 6 (subunit J)